MEGSSCLKTGALSDAVRAMCARVAGVMRSHDLVVKTHEVRTLAQAVVALVYGAPDATLVADWLYEHVVPAHMPGGDAAAMERLLLMVGCAPLTVGMQLSALAPSDVHATLFTERGVSLPIICTIAGVDVPVLSEAAMTALSTLARVDDGVYLRRTDVLPQLTPIQTLQNVADGSMGMSLAGYSRGVLGTEMLQRLCDDMVDRATLVARLVLAMTHARKASRSPVEGEVAPERWAETALRALPGLRAVAQQARAASNERLEWAANELAAPLAVLDDVKDSDDVVILRACIEATFAALFAASKRIAFTQ